jgi:hypothetical protein
MSMHIGKKIIDDIRQTLVADYDLSLTAEEYEIFTSSFAENHEKYYHSAYKSRQCTSFGLMKKILQPDRKEKILLFLSDLAGMEPQIQELQPWNRDHIVHAIHTFFIGVYLLKRISFPENHATRYNPALMWKLIGPTHDLGYPIEIAGNIHKGFIGIMNGILSEINPDALQLKQKACPANLEVLCDGRSANDLIQNRLDEWKLGIDVNDYYEWLQELNRVDHGVIGALAQLKVMDALCQEKETMRIAGNAEAGEMRSHAAIRELDMVSAAAALFVHNIDPRYPRFTNKIHFHAAPIAFLLFLCDTFQEWDRYADRRTIFPGEEFDIEYKDNQVVLSVPSQLATSKREILHKRLEGMPIIVNQQLVVQ